jgi:hypothetical protein
MDGTGQCTVGQGHVVEPGGDSWRHAVERQGRAVNGRTRIAVVLGGVLAVCGALPPASAAAAGNVTESTGGPIRECFRESCQVIITVEPGTKLAWTHFADNQAGNRWYFVKDAERNANFSGGWIYCGNVTAGC